MLKLPFLALLAIGLPAQDLPVTALAHVGFLTSDLDKARQFYTGVLGYEQAFALKNAQGGIAMAFFKVNDEQYIEISSGLAPGQDVRMTHIAFVTPDIEKLHGMLEVRGLAPAKIGNGRDGNRNFSIKDPDGTRIEFVQYMPGSLHTNAKGRFAGERRISGRLRHAGVLVKAANLNAAMAFYRDKLGFVETWRGGPNDAETAWINMRLQAGQDYVELMLYSDPPSRDRRGTLEHICLEVPDIQSAWKTARERGVPGEQRYQPRVGRNKRWQLNLYDPDGSRAELMEPGPAAGTM